MSSEPIVQTLQNDILSGTLPPGTPLGQVELAERFGVSRIPIRDALAQLAAEGLITAAPNQTATVLSMTPKDIEETYHMRILLECDLVEAAVERMTPASLEQIDAALQTSTQSAGREGWPQGDEAFHQTLYAAADCPSQVALTDRLRRKCRIQIAGYDSLKENTERWLDDHAQLAKACHQRDPKQAKRLMRKHLQGARNQLLRAIGQDDRA